jgi:biopolymer transport protein ExbD
MSENEIYVEKTRTTLAGLTAALKQRVSGSDSGQVRAVLEGRASASYQLIVSVLDAFRTNGIENVGLITRKEKIVR